MNYHVIMMRLQILKSGNFQKIQKVTLTTTKFEQGIKTIVMSHSKTRNALSKEMMQNLIQDIKQDWTNPNLRVIIVTGQGLFSAGHNLKELTRKNGTENQKEIFRLATSLMMSIIDCPVPVIARIDGLAAAAGCQLVAQCDLAFCTEKSQFSTPGINFGVFCSTPAIPLSRTIPKANLMKMLLTGQAISSHQAKMWGLVTDTAENTVKMDEKIADICREINQKNRSILAIGKRFYYKQISSDLQTAYGMGEQTMTDNLQLDECQYGIQCFIDKKKPNWQ